MLQHICAKARQWSAAAMLLSLVIGTDTASAAVYQGHWDPLFNLAFSPTVGWKGSTQVTLDDACLTPSTIGPCPSATMDGATIIFYDITDDSTLGSIAWPGPGAGSLQPIDKVSVDLFGNLDGVELATPLLAFTSIFSPNDYDVELDFLLSGPTLKLTDSCEDCTRQSYTNLISR